MKSDTPEIKHESIWTHQSRTPLRPDLVDIRGVRTRYSQASDSRSPALTMERPSALGADAIARDELLALEHARLEALDQQDVAAVGALMDPELIHIHATGRVDDLDAFLAGLRSLPRKTRRISLTIRIYGDTAVLTGEVVTAVFRSAQTAPEEISMMVTQVARRREGRWVFWSFHASKKA